MPDTMIALFVPFLTQNNGILSKRAREMEILEWCFWKFEWVDRKKENPAV